MLSCLGLAWLMNMFCLCQRRDNQNLVDFFLVTLNVTPLFFSFCWFQTISEVQSKMERGFCFIQCTSKQWSFCAEKFNWKNRSRVGPIEFSRTFYLQKNAIARKRRKICGFFLFQHENWRFCFSITVKGQISVSKHRPVWGKLESDFFWNFVMISFSACVKRS